MHRMSPIPDWFYSIDFEQPLDATQAILSLDRPHTAEVGLESQVEMVVFSPSGILYDDSAFARWLVQLLNRLGVRTEYSSFRCLLERDGLRSAYVGQADYWQSLRSMLAEIGLSRSQIKEVEAAGYSRWRSHESNLRLLPGVANTLERLAASGLQLGVIVNSHVAPCELIDRFERLGICHHLHAIVGSRDTGHVLPDDNAFQALIAQLQTPHSRIAFVSNCSMELHAARQAELVSIAVGASEKPPEAIAIKRLTDITTVLHRGQSSLLVA
ncbi:MAG: HAD hydrolase-like protein [Pirellulales bacterium]